MWGRMRYQAEETTSVAPGVHAGETLLRELVDHKQEKNSLCWKVNPISSDVTLLPWSPGHFKRDCPLRCQSQQVFKDSPLLWTCRG